jgi:hypothetical protein
MVGNNFMRQLNLIVSTNKEIKLQDERVKKRYNFALLPWMVNVDCTLAWKLVRSFTRAL